MFIGPHSKDSVIKGGMSLSPTKRDNLDHGIIWVHTFKNRGGGCDFGGGDVLPLLVTGSYIAISLKAQKKNFMLSAWIIPGLASGE